MEKTKKQRKWEERIGWIGLGICADYFVFKPVRKVRPVFLVAFGFALGNAINTQAVMDFLFSFLK